jgi:hypothetical protein
MPRSRKRAQSYSSTPSNPQPAVHVVDRTAARFEVLQRTTRVARYATPASVSAIVRPERSSSGACSVCLSRPICCESAGWETCNSAAARVEIAVIGDRDEVVGVAQKHKQRL